jgi:hypothetical protein
MVALFHRKSLMKRWLHCSMQSPLWSDCCISRSKVPYEAMVALFHPTSVMRR